jgi:hypothetical protein
MDVVKKVKEASGKHFSTHSHKLAWEKHGVRPAGNSKEPEKTNLDYCYYDPIYKNHSYNDAWIDLLVKELD